MATLEVGNHAFVLGAVGAGTPVAVAEAHLNLLGSRNAVQEDLAMALGQLGEGLVVVDALLLAERLEESVEVLGVP